MGTSNRPRLNPFAAVGIGILAASTASIFIRFAQAYSPSIIIAAYRLAIATFLISPFVISRNRDELSSLSKKEFLFSVLSGVFLAVHFSTWIKSLEYTTVASSVVLVSTVPLWVALFSPVILKEPITKQAVAGMIIAFVGVVIIAASDVCFQQNGTMSCPSYGDFLRGKAFIGDLLAIAGAIAAAMYVIIGRSLRQRVSLFTYVFVVYGLAALVLVGAALSTGYELTGYSADAYVWMFLLALVPQLLGHSLFNYALGYLSAAFVSIALLGEPIGSTILAYLILGEVPSWLKIIGAALILAGIYIASLSDIRNRAASIKNQPHEREYQA